MKVVSVFNYKGGVGKTTLTANIGAHLARLGKKVLLIDLDPQASLTFSFIRPDEWSTRFERGKTIMRWFQSHQERTRIPLADLVHKPPAANRMLASKGKLELICSHLDLGEVDKTFAIELVGAYERQCQQNYLSVHRRLVDALAQDFHRSDYDLVLIDCPPNLNTTTEIGVVASDFYLIPVLADELATLGIDHLFRKVTQLVERFNECAELENNTPTIAPRSAGIVFTMIEEHGGVPIASHRQYITHTRNRPAANVYGAYMKRNSTLFGSAPQFGVPVVLRKPNNATEHSVVDGLKRISTEFMMAVGL